MRMSEMDAMNICMHTLYGIWEVDTDEKGTQCMV